MADRVGSDNPTVTTVRATLVRRGGTRRPAVEVSSAGDVPAPDDDQVRLSIDGRWRRAPVRVDEGTWTLLGAFDNARMARERDGTDRLVAWVEAEGFSIGRSVLVDVVEPGAAYGLRAPGEEAVYESGQGPAEGLRRIAEDLES